jgi:hypothetical protein
MDSSRSISISIIWKGNSMNYWILTPDGRA